MRNRPRGGGANGETGLLRVMLHRRHSD
jgi:hypothetical protein